MIELIAGDDQDVVVIVYTDSTKTTVMDISVGITAIKFTVKPEWAVDEADDANALFQKTQAGGDIAITDGANGELTVSIAKADTTGYSRRFTYNFDVQLTFSSGDKRTVLKESCTIIAPITRT